MDEEKRKRLEAKGWKVGTVAEFLDLTPEESALVEIKLALRRNLKERQQKLTTQSELANSVNAKNEDDSISIDLLIRAILATGATPQDIGQVIASIKE
ncbi:MAG TPA: transcriptional regulator [Nostocaceae cyanobacterium]|nr:transcriptional regulator [Nostocaceae cyanobacterium]